MCSRTRMRLAPVLCVLLLCGALGCGGEDTTRWQAAQQESKAQPKAVTEAALPGATFNKFFPKQDGDIDIVFKQEKLGFAQASLQRGGSPIGMLSVFDTRSNPEARDKYKESKDSIGGFPAAVVGKSTSILVADRFQVQVQSEGEALPAEDRALWLEKFDLASLATAH